jgi:hypothetical protein
MAPRLNLAKVFALGPTELANGDNRLLGMLDEVPHLRFRCSTEFLHDVRGAGDRFGLDFQECVHGFDHDLLQQFGLGLDVAVHTRRSDAQCVGDVPHSGGPVSLVGEKERGRGAHVGALVHGPGAAAAGLRGR